MLAGALVAAQSDQSRLPENTTIDGIDVGGLETDVARSALERHVRQHLDEPVEITTPDRPGFAVSVSPRFLRARPQIDQAIEEAIASDSFTHRALTSVGLAGHNDVALRYELSETRAERIVAQVQNRLGKRPVPATVKVVGKRLRVVPGKEGVGMDEAELLEQLRTLPEAISLQVERQPPQVDTAEAEQARCEVDDLAAQVAGNGNAIQLSGNLPSVLIEVGPAVYRLTSLEANVAKADAIIAVDAAESAPAGRWHLLELTTPENDRRTSDREVVWLERLKANGSIEKGFAWRFLTSGDSREPELAGIRGALVGSILTLAVTLLICLPLGVGAAIYLEEFAPKNRLTDLIEININNLAAVPSIVFGLLGLAMFLNFFGLPRSAPLVGGLVLALLVLPTIIIASRAALKAVPPSIKEAALGVGASHQQAIFHHVLPLAVPGIMTGTIIGMAHALGETAPLLMIGMVAFIVDVPQGITDAATAMPVQIYLWSDLPEVAFQAKTAAAIIVLLVLLFVMNAVAIYVRRRFERRW